MPGTRATTVLCVFLGGGVGFWAEHGWTGDTDSHQEQNARPVTVATLHKSSNRHAIQLSDQILSRLDTQPGNITISRFPVRAGREVDLEIERFYVTRPDTRFVLHRSKDDPGHGLGFDPSELILLRGQRRSHPTSHVFLAISRNPRYPSVGYVDLGVGDELYWVSSLLKTDPEYRPERLLVYRARGGPPEAFEEFCHINDAVDVPLSPSHGRASGNPETARGMGFMELAVDTDYEYFKLFGDVNAAAAYVVQLYGAASAIYMRDVRIRLELTYVQLWNHPDDGMSGIPGTVPRDMIQFMTGDPNLPGYASLGGVCDGDYRSVVGKIIGFLPDPDHPSNLHWDLYVMPHELGHNFTACHTHCYNPPLHLCSNQSGGCGGCYDGPPVAMRGTIMSYCGRANGGMSNYDFRFHSFIQEIMENYAAGQSCLDFDCNFNSTPDGQDIQAGQSVDSNQNGIPDECEDCNGNSLLDDADIESGVSRDFNANLVPDECEADCNLNGIPDDLDLASSTSEDDNGNNVPDECEADCNGNGIADHVEMQQNMGLDLDRNAVLDECQDCNHNSISDVEDLAGAHNLWVASSSQNQISEYNAVSGVFVRTADPGWLSAPHDVLAALPGRVLVASFNDHRVVEFDGDGRYIRDLVPAGEGGLVRPSALAITPTSHLLVCSYGTDSILKYSILPPIKSSVFVPTGLGGLSRPSGMTLGPNGNLFVSSRFTHSVLEYDGSSGGFVRMFVASGTGGLNQPRGLTFKADGNLLVASLANDRILEFDGGTGAFVGEFSPGWELEDPWGLRIGPNGNVFVSNHSIPNASTGMSRIYEFDIHNGHAFRHSFVQGEDLDLLAPTGFDFVPGWELDCNVNHILDECDDLPSACALDCNANGIMDRLDIIPFGISTDCNFNRVPDECELVAFDCNGNDQHDACDVRQGFSEDCDLNGLPDECQKQADCNGSQTNDICDIAQLISADCNNNWIPDECEEDCNGNGTADDCDIANYVSMDCNNNSMPDECEPDCNENGLADSCDIAETTSLDCDANAVPDECDIASGAQQDCNLNAVPDECDIAAGASVDCNYDDVPDDCCLFDLSFDGVDDVVDLSILIAEWGPCPEPCTSGQPTCACWADFNRDCTVNAYDLALLLGAWGPCQ